jgi:hypothetical protein
MDILGYQPFILSPQMEVRRGIKKMSIQDLNAYYVCPYCANQAPFNKYLMKMASGEYNRKRAKCPLCLENMRMATLKADMSPYEWGMWLYLNIRVYNSPHFKFHDKWQHDIFFINLSLLSRDIKNDWWEGFKLYKGTSDLKTIRDKLEELNFKFGIYKKRQDIGILDNYSNMQEFTEDDSEDDN